MDVIVKNGSRDSTGGAPTAQMIDIAVLTEGRESS